MDDEGISGIEKDYNNYLKGIPGWVYKTKGWSGKIQHKSGMPFQKSINGSNIQLTIDLEYQSILEEELKRGRKKQILLQLPESLWILRRRSTCNGNHTWV